MNQISHELAETQVSFLTTQVNLAQLRFQQARQKLLAYQNKKGLRKLRRASIPSLPNWRSSVLSSKRSWHLYPGRWIVTTPIW